MGPDEIALLKSRLSEIKGKVVATPRVTLAGLIASAEEAAALRERVRALTEALQDIADHGCDIEAGGCGAGFNATEALRALSGGQTP